MPFRSGMLQTGGRYAADTSSFALLDAAASDALHRALLVIPVESLADFSLGKRCGAWNPVLIQSAYDHLRGVPSAFLNIQAMGLHDQLELCERGHVILAALLRDDPYLLHDVASCRVETARVDSQSSVALSVAVTDGESVSWCNLRKQLHTSAVLLEIMDLTPMLVDPYRNHMVVFPVYVLMAVDDVRLVSIAQAFHQFTHKSLELVICKMLVRRRVYRHVKGKVLRADIASLIEPEGILYAQSLVYGVLVQELGFSAGALLLVVFQGEAG